MSASGVEGFLAGLTERGAEAEREDDFVHYSVRAPRGPYAGKSIRTAVAVADLAAWPAMPPHWVQFPHEVKLDSPNPDQSQTAPGFTRHSRSFTAWEQVTDPPQAWLAHVRYVLGAALA